MSNVIASQRRDVFETRCTVVCMDMPIQICQALLNVIYNYLSYFGSYLSFFFSLCLVNFNHGSLRSDSNKKINNNNNKNNNNALMQA